MRRPLSLLSALLLYALLSSSVHAQDFVIWTRYDLSDSNDPNAVTLNEKIARFEEETGFRVVHEQIAWDQMTTALAIAVQAGGSVPDMVEMGSQHIPSLLESGVLRTLDDILEGAEWVADLTEGDSLACIADGARHCVAHNVRGGVTYYRSELFPEGFPQSKEGWLELAPVMRDEVGFFSSQFAGRSFSAVELVWWPMIASNGGTIFDEEGQPAWANEAVVEVVEFGRQLFSEGYFPEVNVTGDFADAEAPWLDGSAASFRGGSWSAIFVPGLQDSVESGDVRMTGGVDFGGGPRVFMVSEGWVVPNGAENLEAARQWLDQFFEPEPLAAWAAAQFGIPTLASAYDIAAFDSTFYQAVDEILGSQGIYMQPSPYYLESLDALAVALQELFLDTSLDIMDHLAEAEREVINRFW